MELFSEILGKSVRVPEVPRRIISFSPAVTEVLFELGLEEAIVGVSAFCARPAEARLKRKVGSYNTVSDEVLDDLRPDLILTTTGYQRQFALRLAEKYPVYPFELPVSVAGIVDMVVKVGLVTSRQEQARNLGKFLLDQLSVVQTTRRLSVYVEIDLGGPVSFGAHSYITDAFNLLGSTTLFESERTEWLTPDLHTVQTLDPDVIFYEPKMYSRFGAEDARAMFGSRGWEGMRAVRVGNAFVTPGPLDFIAHHGPSFIRETIPWLNERLEEAASRV